MDFLTVVLAYISNHLSKLTLIISPECKSCYIEPRFQSSPRYRFNIIIIKHQITGPSEHSSASSPPPSLPSSITLFTPRRCYDSLPSAASYPPQRLTTPDRNGPMAATCIPKALKLDPHARHPPQSVTAAYPAILKLVPTPFPPPVPPYALTGRKSDRACLAP